MAGITGLRLDSSDKGREVFERFSEEARRVVVLAQEEARALNHSYIGTEHILLGVLREEEQAGDPQPLHSLGLSVEDVRREVRRIVGSGDEPAAEMVPFTPRAKKVLELALREALALGTNWIGPEHIVLGITREGEGVASRILLDFDADPEKVRDRVIQFLPEQAPRSVVTHPGPGTLRRSVESEWLGGLDGVLDQLGREIRSQLGRGPDVGDLLLAIACARPSVAAQALAALKVDLDALWGTLERIRHQEAQQGDELTRRISQVRAQKREALEREEYAEAGKLRDQERELVGQLGSARGVDIAVLDEIRRRLGLTRQDRPTAESQ